MKNLLPLFILFIYPLLSPAQDLNTQLQTLQTADGGTAYRTIKDLQQQPKDSYDKESRQKLIDYLNNNPVHLGEALKLAGYLELREAIPAIRAIADSSGFSSRDRWAAYLALARMEDPRAINFINRRVSELPINNDFVYEVVPDIVYTRNKQLLQYLIEILNDDTPSCTSANPDNEVPIACGYRIMEYLAPAIEGYPFQLSASGDLDTDNYHQALNEVRAWFREKGQGFIISRDKF